MTPQVGGALCGAALAVVMHLLQPSPLRMELLRALTPAAMATATAPLAVVVSATPSLPPRQPMDATKTPSTPADEPCATGLCH
jgi:hypothetical protein